MEELLVLYFWVLLEKQCSFDPSSQQPERSSVTWKFFRKIQKWLRFPFPQQNDSAHNVILSAKNTLLVCYFGDNDEPMACPSTQRRRFPETNDQDQRGARLNKNESMT